jgi:hypothetical protein
MTIHIDSEMPWTDLQKQMPTDVVDGLNAGWQEIVDAKRVDRCLKAGNRAPDFSLPSASGKIVSLQQQLAGGPVVLTFYRGVWCPFCNLALQTDQSSLDRITAKGAP